MIQYLLSKNTVDTSSRHTLTEMSCGFITYGLELRNDTYSVSSLHSEY